MQEKILIWEKLLPAAISLLALVGISWFYLFGAKANTKELSKPKYSLLFGIAIFIILLLWSLSTWLVR